MPGNSGCPKLKSSVFEDSSHFFAEEGTPLNFSKATSLSSLPSCYDSLEKDISKMSLQEKVDGNLFAPGIDSKSSPDSNESVDYQVS